MRTVFGRVASQFLFVLVYLAVFVRLNAGFLDQSVNFIGFG